MVEWILLFETPCLFPDKQLCVCSMNQTSINRDSWVNHFVDEIIHHLSSNKTCQIVSSHPIATRSSCVSNQCHVINLVIPFAEKGIYTCVLVWISYIVWSIQMLICQINFWLSGIANFVNSANKTINKGESFPSAVLSSC